MEYTADQPVYQTGVNYDANNDDEEEMAQPDWSDDRDGEDQNGDDEDDEVLPSSSKVLIENLPFKIQWQALKDMIKTKVDPKIEIFVDLVKSGGRSTGEAIVNFNKPEIAARAIKILNGYSYEGRTLTVKEESDGPSRKRRRSRSSSPRVKSRKIIVGNLPFSATWQDLKDFFRDKVGEVDYAQIDQASDGSSKGTGVVSFYETSAAQKALDNINNQDFLGRKIFIREEQREDRERSSSGKSMSFGSQQVNIDQRMLQYLGVDKASNIVYVGNLDSTTQWQKLKDIFRLAGNVAHVKMLSDYDNRSKGMALVHYESPYDALQAISMLNGCEFYGRPMYVRMYTEVMDRLMNSGHRQNPDLPAGLNRIGPDLQTLKARLGGSGGLGGGGFPSGYGGDGNMQDLAGMAYMLQSLFNTANTMPNTMGSSTQKSSGRPTNSICVENLDRSVTWQALKDRFKAIGNVQFTDVIKQGGRSTGCGLVRFSTTDDAERAVRLMNGVKFEGTTIRVYLDN